MSRGRPFHTWAGIGSRKLKVAAHTALLEEKSKQNYVVINSINQFITCLCNVKARGK